MIATVIEFTDLLLCGLLVGTIFGVWLMLQPADVDATTYVLMQQNAIRALNNLMPPLGGLALLVTVAAAVIAREDHVRFGMLVVAAVCLAAAGIVTRFWNQPINAIVMTWSAAAPPAQWTGLRDQWWHWHLVRMGSTFAAYSLIIAAAIRRV
jgi:hypothetical protein